MGKGKACLICKRGLHKNDFVALYDNSICELIWMCEECAKKKSDFPPCVLYIKKGYTGDSDFRPPSTGPDNKEVSDGRW